MRHAILSVSAGPARLHVRLMGAGKLLVLLPGLGRPATDLDALAALLADGGYRVAQPDPRGNGGSTGPMQGLTLHDLAADVSAVIEALGGGPATLIGQAFGNRIARMTATDRRDLVRAVVLLGCSGKVQPTPEIADAIRLAQAVDTPFEVRARAVRAAWFAPGADISVWLDGWSQPVMRGVSRRRRGDRHRVVVDRRHRAGADRAGCGGCQRAARQRPSAASRDRRARHAGRSARNWPRGRRRGAGCGRAGGATVAGRTIAGRCGVSARQGLRTPTKES